MQHVGIASIATCVDCNQRACTTGPDQQCRELVDDEVLSHADNKEIVWCLTDVLVAEFTHKKGTNSTTLAAATLCHLARIFDLPRGQ